MFLNFLGIVAALATFIGVWLGHVSVRKIEASSPTIWLPAVIALMLGLGLASWSLVTGNLHASAALGIFGLTILWDALEFTRQSQRIARGHAPANPSNPRHVPLLAEGKATTLDLLKRDPIGRPVSPEEDVALVQKDAR